MSDPADLTNLADVKAWLSVPATSVQDDPLLSRLITAASKYIQQWLNRTIASASYTETRDGNGGFRLSFANYPVTAVASLTIDDQPIPQSTAVAAPGYVFSPTAISLRGGYQFTRDMQNVVVSYTAGFATTPSELAQACIEVISLRYRERDRIGVVSKGLAGETTAFSQKDFPASVMTILNNWKKVIPL